MLFKRACFAVDKTSTIKSGAKTVFTDSFHHAGLSGVSFHWDNILKAVQRNDTLASIPHLKDVLHFAAQFLNQKTQEDGFVHTPIIIDFLILLCVSPYLGGFISFVVL